MTIMILLIVQSIIIMIRTQFIIDIYYKYLKTHYKYVKYLYTTNVLLIIPSII